jgi:hypothetical protein
MQVLLLNSVLNVLQNFINCFGDDRICNKLFMDKNKADKY